MPSTRANTVGAAEAVVRFEMQDPGLVIRKALDEYLSEFTSPDPYGFSVDSPDRRQELA
jgi:hypothetical protein